MVLKLCAAVAFKAGVPVAGTTTGTSAMVPGAPIASIHPNFSSA